MAKKNRSLPPRRKRMTRQGRIASGIHWIKKYNGKDVIKGYAKWYSVSKLCALIELRKIGVNISDGQIEQEQQAEIRKGINNAAARQKKAEKEAEREGIFAESDEHFSFIAGYTSGGAPYGVTWEESDAVHDDEWDDFNQLSMDRKALMENKHIAFTSATTSYNEALDGDIVQVDFEEDPNEDPFHRTRYSLSVR